MYTGRVLPLWHSWLRAHYVVKAENIGRRKYQEREQQQYY